MLLERLSHWREIARATLEFERKKGKTVRRERDEIEFLPAALEILETPVSPVGRALMWSLMILFAIALGWACIGKVDIVAIAQGKVVPNGKSKVIQPLEAGVVKAILVENGQHVLAGQSLIELDPTQTVADLDKSRTARVDYALNVARARALLDAQEHGTIARLMPQADAGPDRLHDAERLAQSALAEYRNKLTALQAELQKRQQELETTRHKITGLQQTLPITQGQAQDYKSLLAQNYVSRHGYLEKEQARIAQEQELASQLSYAKELEATIREQRTNIDTAISQFRREQLDLLNQSQQLLAQAQGDETKSAQRQSQMRLLAPVAGTVQQLAVHTVGGVVTPAQELLVIVPDDGQLEIEAQLLNQDIGFVRPGQTVEVKLDAFPYTHYGTIAGKVVSLSQDAVRDEKLGLVYQTRIALAKKSIAADGKNVPLSPGMIAASEIRLEQRRIIEYLLTPLLRYKNEALRER